MDYGTAKHDVEPIKTLKFEMINKLDYGGSEGTYLDLWIAYYENGSEKKSGLGTFKTLQDDDEAMHAMAGLLADFVLEMNNYKVTHPDDFVWEGVDVWALDEQGEQYTWSDTCCDMETALKRKDKLLQKYPQVVVRDNETRKKEIFKRKELVLTYLGMDSWDRPVYSEPSGKLWKDVAPLKSAIPRLCTSVNNEFDGEPCDNMRDMGEYRDVKITYIPERITIY